MMKKYILLFIFAYLCIPIFSTNISPEEARKVARNFLQEKGYAVKDAGSQLSLLSEAKGSGEVLFYTFNVEDRGFVIVSGKTTTYPILAYSLSGNFASNPAVEFWLSRYEEQLAGASKGEAVWDGVPAQWEHYLADDFHPRQEKSGAAIAPLLTSLWNQTQYYNTYCPWDAAAGSYYDYRVPNGCVALCMAQIMYYYRFPAQGVGGVSYVPSPYPRQYVLFSEHTYHYDAMTDRLNDYNGEVAKLVYHAGVSTQMGYTPDGSGTYTETAMQKMVQHFKYSPEVRKVFPDEFPDTLTKYYVGMLLTELAAKRPIVYSGSAENSSGGHAFILDGADPDSLFHVNWGWGGSSNGYFRITNLDPGQSNFSDNAQGFIKLYPNNAASPLLTGHDRLTATVGSFSSGNMYLPYTANPSKTWMLAAPHATAYHIKTNKLDLAPSDRIIIYNGPTMESGVKAVLDPTRIGQEITVEADSVLVALSSDGSSTVNDSYYGFHISYATTLNPAPVTLYETLNFQTQANLTPETLEGLYLPQQECTWVLNPTYITGFAFVVKDFDLRKGDFLDLYNATTYPPTLWKRFDLYNPPTWEPYHANFNKMNVVFHSDNWQEGRGFDFEYYTILGVDAPQGVEDLSVYPNPAESQVEVKFHGTKSGQVTLQLYDVAGKMLENRTYSHEGGLFSGQIPVDHLAPGFYLLHIESPAGKSIRKISVR